MRLFLCDVMSIFNPAVDDTLGCAVKHADQSSCLEKFVILLRRSNVGIVKQPRLIHLPKCSITLEIKQLQQSFH